MIADVEGSGYFHALEKTKDLDVLVDDNACSRFEGTYDQSLLVKTASPGTATVSVIIGRTRPPLGHIEKGQKFEGSGWILGSNHEFITDSDHEPRRVPEERFPVPFFRTVIGEDLAVILSSVVYRPIDAFEVSDQQALEARGWSVQNMSALSELSSSFQDGAPLSASLVSHLNAASWTVPIPAGCKGLVVRKLYDAFHGRQRARVLVDGTFVGWWYEPWQNREHRWRWARFGIDEVFIGGKGSVVLTIDPPAGAPLWSVSRIEIWGAFAQPDQPV